MSSALYLDTSAVLRPMLERTMSADIESRIAAADLLVTSRLSLVETARSLLRVRRLGSLSETALADAERSVAGLWRRSEIWELTREVCELAEVVAPAVPLRSLDAIHLATFVLARRELADLEILTADERLQRAVSQAQD